ncbi:MAG: hypothetical protein ABIH23_30525 [bacterium]
MSLWDTDTGERLGTYKTGEFNSPRIDKISSSVDGTKILAAIQEMGGTIGPAGYTCGGVIWDAETGTILFSELSSPTRSMSAYSNISISPSSTMVAFGPGLYDLKTGDLIKQFPGHYIVFSPDEPILASVSTSTSHKVQIGLWDASTVQRIGFIEYGEQTDKSDPMEVPNVTFSPDGSMLAAITEYSGRLWNARTGEELGNLGPYAALLHANERTVAFSPDGARLITLGDDYDLRAARMWDISDFVRRAGIESFLRY